MTTALGTTHCSRLGCTRRRYVTPAGVTYGNCAEHTSALLTGAFGQPRPLGENVAGAPRRGVLTEEPRLPHLPAA